MYNLKKPVLFALACSMYFASGSAHALGDQWYFGLGGSSTWLQPNAEEPGVGLSRRHSAGGNVFFGADIDDRSSGQLTLYSLGDAKLENREIVPFQAFDGSILYRLYDTNDRRLRPSSVSLALYGRFALGYMNRDTDVSLKNDAAVYFGVGGGAELFLSRNISMRLEGMYHDSDAASGTLALVARFGGARPAPVVRSPTPVPQPDTAVVQPQLPAAPSTPVPVIPIPTQSLLADADGDTVPDARDRCAGSRVGYPVRATGCALFDGVLSGVNFTEGTAELTSGSTDQLDFFVNVLTQYPVARVELHAHTDDQGTVREQAILTRARLRSIGTYLVSQGVKSNRLVLRSFGGTRPLYDNANTQGQAANNRIEVIEHSN